MLTNVTKLPATNTPGYLLLRLLFFRNKFTNTHLVASLYRVDRRDYRISSLHLFSSELNQSRERQRVREKGLRESDYCPFLPCLRLSVEPFRLCGLAALRGRPERLLGQRQPWRQQSTTRQQIVLQKNNFLFALESNCFRTYLALIPVEYQF